MIPTLTKQHAPQLIPILSELPSHALPVYMGKVSAGRTTGFASPAQDYEKDGLDILKKLVTNPPATFICYVGKDDDSMVDAGIYPGAIIIVDRSIDFKSGLNVLVVVDGEFMVKRLYRKRKEDDYELHSKNSIKNYPPIRYREGIQIEFEGVVTSAVTIFRK